MKNILPLFIVVYLLAVCSCQHRQSYPPQFLVADSLASVHPDSAIALLESLKADSLQWDKATQMYYSLLTIKAQDKAYIPQTSDSLMLQVLHYYEHGGDKRLLPEAYYYMGSTYRDMNDAPRALEYYQKALEVLPEEASPLRRYVNNQMGWLFYRQYLYDEALACYQRSFSNDSLLNDKREMASDLNNIAYIYRCYDDYATSLSIYEHARSLVEASDRFALAEIDTQIAGLYLSLGKTEDAMRYISLPLQNLSRANVSSIYSIAAKVYLKAGRQDSAFFYLNKLLDEGNIYGRRMAYENLGTIALDNNRKEEAVLYIQKFRILSDSIQELNAVESIAQMKSLFNYQKAIEEREVISQRYTTNLKIIFILSLAFILLSFAVVLSNMRMKQHRKLMLDKLNELEQSQQIDNEKAARSISEKNERIKELEKELENIGNTNREFVSYIKQKKADIHQQVEETERKLQYKEQTDAKLKESRIYGHLIYLINNKKKLSVTGFKELIEAYQEIAPEFMEKLLSLCIMNDLEIEVTLLRRLGISPNDIALLTSYSKQHISGIRKALFKRAKGIDGEPSQWDELISFL
ncbi:MAG: tetratricopeptide repeat protein [Bacteroidales bacterium]|nr:tetratricopeptide repeat protein [Bacteroidales bacterium]